MKSRVTLSLDAVTVDYLTRHAKSETDGNMSAYVDRLVRDRLLAESVRAEAAWYAANPGYVDAAEAERYAA